MTKPAPFITAEAHVEHRGKPEERRYVTVALPFREADIDPDAADALAAQLTAAAEQARS